MCSIFGAFGRDIDPGILGDIRRRAQDRGRDGGRVTFYDMPDGYTAVLGNWRATPTTESVAPDLQPYDGVVHNGTIANDRELGNPPGEIDSKVLPRVLDRSSVRALAASLGRVKGSYALAVAGTNTVYLAANYKPVYYIGIEGTVYFSSMERHLAGVAPWGTRPAKLEPYTALDLRTGEKGMLAREIHKRALVICSSGLDSTTVAYKLKSDGWDVTLLHFLYGCKAETREARLVEEIGKHLGAPVVFLDLDYSKFAGGSPLLTDKEIAGGVEGAEFAHEWVPARNLLMIANAVAYAEANGFGAVALGNNLEESGAYPDNEEEFTHLLDAALDYAVHDGGIVRLLSPVGHLMKHEIVKLGDELGVPYELTWSCYSGGERHCGECGPCYMRKTAFARNGLQDPVFRAEETP